ncbi:MAG: ectonucleotide pyrophosphatase/phosphodiesterase [Clostridiales bacterium]|jgi:predicted AlkP superfamily pyrophosphatase or phosphodiesterase|nr:ectonucleotide pyrophosphatase/phosphodiesterase [Clostridiales bacterium]
MLIISFDAVGDGQFDRLAGYPAMSGFIKQSSVRRGVSTVFLSNTYPVHTSVATGVPPREHGLISNTEPFPARHPVWNTRESRIKAKTIWQSAREKGIKTAAVLWPVTAYSKTVDYNIPEAHTLPGESQIMANLKSGSFFLQMKLFLRHRKLLDGISQPALDRFAAACAADILREKKPGLTLIHLTAYDSLCHQYGKDAPEMEAAFRSLDNNLRRLLAAAGEDEDVLLFSDHGQINVHTVLTPNEMLVDRGLLRKEAGPAGYMAGESGCFMECCAGSAFFHPGKLSKDKTEEIREAVSQSEGFRRFLTEDELCVSGMEHAAFGFCAGEGYCYEARASGYRGNHGYPLDMPDYSVFYMTRGFGGKPGGVIQGGSLLDIAPMVKKRMGL